MIPPAMKPTDVKAGTRNDKRETRNVLPDVKTVTRNDKRETRNVLPDAKTGTRNEKRETRNVLLQSGLRITVVGCGPAGLYFAILMKRLNPAHQITILERDRPNDTFGWGIVFSDQTFSYLNDSDPESHAEIMKAGEVWDNVDVVHRGQRVTIRGNRFSGIARLT